MDYPEWFFMWSNGTPYITNVCGWTKMEVIRRVEEMNSKKWKEIYARGGRVVRVRLEVLPDKTRRI